MMRIGSINNVSFRSVTPIATKPGNLPKIEKQLKENANGVSFDLNDCTHLYEGIPNTGGVCWNAVNKQHLDLGFLVTGEEYHKASVKELGWSSEAAPTRHIDKDIEIVPDKFDKKTLNKLTERIKEPKNSD